MRFTAHQPVPYHFIETPACVVANECLYLHAPGFTVWLFADEVKDVKISLQFWHTKIAFLLF